MSLRRGVGTLAVALTITGASAAPASAHFFTTEFQPYTALPSLAHHQHLEAGATMIRRHKHASAGSHRQVAGGMGKRDGLPTGTS
jgi:hypothetical protein